MECPPSHFPFTLPEAPGEYSPSCQCNVAHRGNHAASLASGLPAPSRKCNFSTSSSHPQLLRKSMGWLPTQYETSSLMSGVQFCRALAAPPPRSGNMHHCLYVSSAHVEKDLSWMRRDPPTLGATFGFMSPVPSLSVSQGNLRHSGGTGRPQTPEQSDAWGRPR